MLLAASGLEAGPLDVAWSRAGRSGEARIGVVLDRLAVPFVPTPPESRTQPPRLRRFMPIHLAHVDAYARAMHQRRSRVEAALAAGITTQQAAEFDRAALELLVRRGYSPWNIHGHAGDRYSLSVPRRIEGSDALFGLLHQPPSDQLMAVAAAWVAQPYVDRRHGDGALLRVSEPLAHAIQELLSVTGIAMMVIATDEGNLLVETARDGGISGHAAALRWVLAITWIFGNSFSQAGLAPSAS